MAISLLIVGHANTGKTSLIRTLMRDRRFGEVDNRSGTTRHVEEIPLSVKGETLLRLIDTPGFEDSMGLWQTRRMAPYDQQTNQQWLEQIITDEALTKHFDQEFKILNQLPHCDITLYLIDLRQAPLEKYLNELDILACANKPIVPVLNFCNGEPSHLEAWKQCLAERQLHAHVRYDTVAFYFADERKLYQTLQSLSPDHYDALQSLISQRQQDAQQRLQRAQNQLASTLISCATYQHLCASTKPSPQDQLEFETKIRIQEEHFIQQCLGIYDFQSSDVALQNLDIDGHQWEQDLFDAQTLKSWGIQTTTVAATGAAIGAGIDILSAGLTLGTATTLGALLGAGWQTGQSFKASLVNKLRNRAVLAANSGTLIALLYRSTELINHLHHRGHAAQVAFQAKNEVMPSKEDLGRLDKLFKKLAQRTEWQALDETDPLPRHQLIESLTKEISHLSTKN